MTINTAISLAWQKKRSDLNHDWLQNKFMVILDDWIASIQKDRTHIWSQDLFSEEICSQWENSEDQFFQLLEDYAKCMSSRMIIENPNCIKYMKPYWREFLVDFMHSLWMFRCDVETRKGEVYKAFVNANGAYTRLKAAFADASPRHETKPVLQLFSELKSRCLDLRKAISLLESSIKVT